MARVIWTSQLGTYQPGRVDVALGVAARRRPNQHERARPCVMLDWWTTWTSTDPVRQHGAWDRPRWDSVLFEVRAPRRLTGRELVGR